MTDHDVDLLVGWSNKVTPRASIGPNGQDNHWEVPLRAEFKYPGHTSPLSLKFSALLNSSLLLNPFLDLSLSLRKNELSGKMNSLFSHVLWTTPSQLLPWWEEKPPSLFTSFYSFTLVYFLSVSSCAKLRLPRTTSTKTQQSSSQEPTPTSTTPEL